MPKFEKRWNDYSKSIGGSWRVDETYVLIKKRWHQLYRAVKGRCVPMLGFKSFDSLATTIAGIELGHRTRKKQSALGHARGAYRFNMRTGWERAPFGTA